MDEFKASEQAYKNGFEDGKKSVLDSIVNCNDCFFCIKCKDPERPYCRKFDFGVSNDGYCKWGQRK